MKPQLIRRRPPVTASNRNHAKATTKKLHKQSPQKMVLKNQPSLESMAAKTHQAERPPNHKRNPTEKNNSVPNHRRPTTPLKLHTPQNSLHRHKPRSSNTAPKTEEQKNAYNPTHHCNRRTLPPMVPRAQRYKIQAILTLTSKPIIAPRTLHPRTTSDTSLHSTKTRHPWPP